MKKWTQTALIACSTLTFAAPSLAERVALLVGVGAYKNLDGRSQLSGPSNDVQAMKSVLVRRWGFQADNVRTLIDAQATRAAILSELKALKGRTKEGDEIVYYVSGHGTSAYDATLRLPLPQGTGAFAPYDADPNSKLPLDTLIVGQRDLRPILADLEQSGRKVWAISDSCFSGQQVRSAAFAEGLQPRFIALPSDEQKADIALASQGKQVEPYPYKAVQYLSAASEGERALDIPLESLSAFPTLDGKTHGAFTDALLRVLEGQIPGDLDQDGYMSLSEVHRAVGDFMSTRGYGHSPQRLPALGEDDLALGQSPVLKVSKAAMMADKAPPRPLLVSIQPALPFDKGLLGKLPNLQFTPDSSKADIKLTPVFGFKNKLAVRTAAGDLIASHELADKQAWQGQLTQLAWAHRLQQVAKSNRRALLEASIEPAQMGGNFIIDSRISMVVKPRQAAHLLMLNINAEGKVNVIYPNSKDELRTVKQDAAYKISNIPVTLPYGMDVQFMFAFDEPLPEGDSWLIPTPVDPSHGRLVSLEGLLEKRAGRFTFTSTELRTLPKPTASH